MTEKLILIDGSSLLSTHYYGMLPKPILFAKTEEEREKHYGKILQNKKGQFTNGAFGMTKAMLKLIREQKPTHLAVAWDISRKTTFRREAYAEYKGTRGETPYPLKEQFPLMQELLGRLGIAQFMHAEYEADDYLGTLSRKFEKEIPTYILTKDRDALQLVSDHTRLWLMQTSEDKAKELCQSYYPEGPEFNIPRNCFELTPQIVKAEFGVHPDCCVMLKALTGDASDNIPGVKGVGAASAVPLVNEYRTIDNLYADIENIDGKEEKEIKAFWKEYLGISRSPLSFLLKDGAREAAKMSEFLGTIKTDIPVEASLDDLKINICETEMKECFEELEFQSLIL